jgi:hypothetical protein
MFVTARHIGREGLYMSKMVQWAFEGWGIDIAAPHLMVLAESVCREMTARLRSLPPSTDLAEATRREALFVDSQKDAQFTEMKMSDHEAVFRMFCTPGEAKMICDAVGYDVKRLDTLARDAIPVYARLAEIVQLPMDKVGAAVIALGREYRTTNPYVVYMVRLADKLWFADIRAQIRFAQLQAALAIRLNDRDAWNAAKDPATGRPFGYRTFKGGFELSSALRQLEQPPIDLVVGERPEGWLRKVSRLLRGA